MKKIKDMIGNFGFNVILAVVLLAIATIVSETSEPFAGFLILLGIVFIVRAVKLRKPKSKALSSAGQNPILRQLEQIERGEVPVVTDSAVIPKRGEIVHLYAPAVRYITKNRVVGHSASSGGVSVRIAKGLSYRTGGVKGTSVYADVTGTFPGHLAITNQRISFIGERESFSVTLRRLIAVSDGGGGKLVIVTPDGEYVLHILASAAYAGKSGKTRASAVFGVAACITKLLSLISNESEQGDSDETTDND